MAGKGQDGQHMGMLSLKVGWQTNKIRKKNPNRPNAASSTVYIAYAVRRHVRNWGTPKETQKHVHHQIAINVG